MSNFIKIPNKMVIGDNSLIKKYGRKALAVYIYLREYEPLRGVINISLGDCIKECGYIPKSGKNNSIEKFRNILTGFKKEGVIKSEVNLDKVKVNDLIKCCLEEVSDRFFILTDDEINKIYGYEGKEDKLNILVVYSEVKARIYKNKDNTESRYTGHFEVAFPSYKKIAEDTRICSMATIKKCLSILIDDLELLIVGNNGDRIKDGIVKRDNNTYALNDDEGIRSLKHSLKYFKKENENNGWEYKTFKDNRALGGEKAQINKKIKKGIATESDINRLIEIDSILNKDNYKILKKDEIEDCA